MIREFFAADVEGIEGIGAVGAVFEQVFFLRKLRKRQADDLGLGELLLQSSCSELKVHRTCLCGYRFMRFACEEPVAAYITPPAEIENVSR